jgi:hypothetical protein
MDFMIKFVLTVSWDNIKLVEDTFLDGKADFPIEPGC